MKLLPLSVLTALLLVTWCRQYSWANEPNSSIEVRSACTALLSHPSPKAIDPTEFRLNSILIPNVIPQSWIQELSYYQDLHGDQVKLLTVPLEELRDGRGQLCHTEIQCQALALRTEAPPKDLISRYVDLYYAKNGLDANTRQMLIDEFRRDRKYWPDIIKSVPVVASARPGLILQTFGLNRYFWVKLAGSDRWSAARILDIHRLVGSPQQGSANGVALIFAETIEDTDGESLRKRQVVQLSVDEFKTIRRDDQYSAEEAAIRFKENLTAVEWQVVRLAQSLKLKLFGFSEWRRFPGQSTDEFVKSAYDILHAAANVAVAKYIKDDFADISDLMLPHEGQQHIIDVFARLDPAYVWSRFKKNEYLYTWVITEDGSLKIMPKGPLINNMTPRLFRLAGGRKVYAGGDLKVDERGEVEVILKSTSYQQFGPSLLDSPGFQQGNNDLFKFVHLVFFMSMGVDVKVPAGPEEFFMAEEVARGARASAFNFEQEEHRFSDFISRFFANAERNTRSARSPLRALGSWTPGKDFPLEFNEWVEAFRSGAEANNTIASIEWAMYVLKVDQNVTKKELAKQRARLVKRYHSDLQSDSENKELNLLAAASINRAYDILKENWFTND